MKRQVTEEQALKLHALGVDVKMLVPNTKTSDWKDMFPTTLNDILDGAEFYMDDWYLDRLTETKKEPEPEPQTKPEDDDELPEELKMKLPVKPPEKEPEPKKPVRKVGQPVPLDEGRIIALRKADPPRSYRWIAEDMGVSEATIFNRCKKLTEEGRL